MTLDQKRREGRHILEREQWVQGPKAGAFLECNNVEGDRG